MDRGGVCLYISSDLAFNPWYQVLLYKLNYLLTDNVESVWVEVLWRFRCTGYVISLILINRILI